MNKNGKLKTVSTPSLANTNHRKKIAELRPSWASSAFFSTEREYKTWILFTPDNQ